MTNIIPFPKQKPAIQPLFSKGDCFTTEDGVFVYVADERETAGGRQLLVKAHGVSMWVDDTRFMRQA